MLCQLHTRLPRKLPSRLLAALVLLKCAAYAQTGDIDLSQQTWVLSNGHGTLHLNTTLPSYALAELQRAGLIQDPLHGYALVWRQPALQLPQ